MRRRIHARPDTNTHIHIEVEMHVPHLKRVRFRV